uniref:Uncharacterized protein n=1 Tax=Rhizophora mucronata TaxID=61149 RepID=A0A2P2PVM2_RHIMU
MNFPPQGLQQVLDLSYHT